MEKILEWLFFYILGMPWGDINDLLNLHLNFHPKIKFTTERTAIFTHFH